MSAKMILLIVILILLAALMILSFIGPEKGGGRFWRIIQYPPPIEAGDSPL